MTNLLQRGQRAFRRELARDEVETARRLQQAYAEFLKDIEDELHELENAAGDASSTKDLRTLPIFQQLQEEVLFALNDLSKLIERESHKLENAGIKTSKDYVESIFRQVGITGSFNQPSVETIKSLAGYVDSEPFQSNINRYGAYHSRHIGNIVLTDASLGKSPITTARHIRQWLSTMPQVDAFRMTRTVQLWAARAGTRERFRANRDIVLGWWWSSALDGRTCMSCISLHGQKFSVDDILADHHQGRCAAVPITSVTVDMPVQTGEEWFRGLPEDEQIQMMGISKWQAWKDGEFAFNDLTTSYQDPVYGTMYTANSLRGIRDSKFDRTVRPEAYRPTPIDLSFKAEQLLLPFEKARLIPPDKLEDADMDDPVVQELWGLAEYDDRANVLYNKLAVDNRYSDMLYELYKIGRSEPTPKDIEDARLVSGVVLAAYQHLEVKLTAKQKKLLEGLAFGDANAAINTVKDNRMKTRYKTGGYKGGSGFVSAAAADAAERLRENRTPVRGF